MRLITWNCQHGDCDERAAELDEHNADIIVLQECKRPVSPHSETTQWFGENPKKGVAVISRGEFGLERGPVAPTLTHSVFPVRVVGPVSFNLLAIHAWKIPTYVEAIDNGITTYADFLRSDVSLMAGDFNSHWRFDPKYSPKSHTNLVMRLADEFELVSAYHAVVTGEEEPTYFHQYNSEKPFHIDYCFIPSVHVAKIREVRVAKFPDWKQRSDHHPLLVDLDI